MKYLLTLLIISFCTNAFAIGSFNKCDSGKNFSTFSSVSKLERIALLGDKLEYTITAPKKISHFEFYDFRLSIGRGKKVTLDVLKSDRDKVVGTFIVAKKNELNLSILVGYARPKPKEGDIIPSDGGWCAVNVKHAGELTPRI